MRAARRVRATDADTDTCPPLCARAPCGLVACSPAGASGAIGASGCGRALATNPARRCRTHAAPAGPAPPRPERNAAQCDKLIARVGLDSAQIAMRANPWTISYSQELVGARVGARGAPPARAHTAVATTYRLDRGVRNGGAPPPLTAPPAAARRPLPQNKVDGCAHELGCSTEKYERLLKNNQRLVGAGSATGVC